MSAERSRYAGVLVEHDEDEPREVLGLIRSDSHGDVIFVNITEVRASEALRDSMPAAIRAREQQVWEDLVQTDRIHWEWRMHWTPDLTPEQERAYKHRRRLKEAYRKICRWEETKAAEVSPRVRRQVIAAWEKAGRKCVICAGAVSSEETIHVHHIVPASQGGSGEPSNLGVAHARCNLRRGDNRMTWAMDTTRHREPCAVCCRSTNSGVQLRFAGEVKARVALCHKHLDFETAENLIDAEQAVGI